MSEQIVTQSPKMIVGLGNPGAKYRYNRHNIGFQCIDLFAQRHGCELNKSQLNALVGLGWVSKQGQKHKVILVKPMTFMNASGTAIGPIARYYQIEPQEILVIHDDIDLAAGTLRLRVNGGSGGQNGIKSLIQHLGSQDFHRARVGVGRPPGRMDPAAYVLQDFTRKEEEEFGPLRTEVLDAVECWLVEGIQIAMNRYNG